LKVGGKVGFSKIDKPEIKGHLKISVLDFDRNKVDASTSLSKYKSEIDPNVSIPKVLVLPPHMKKNNEAAIHFKPMENQNTHICKIRSAKRS
jgi:hypothetical protein